MTRALEEKLPGLIGDGSGHILNDGIVVDGLIRVSSICATVISVHV
jgi:hypothetical protein